MKLDNKQATLDKSGAWNDHDVQNLVRMWRTGMKNSDIARELNRSPNAISVKASRIGLPPKEHIQNMPPGMKIRCCLRCRSQFFSEGPGNRICGACKNTDEWRSGGGYQIIS